MKLLKYLIIGLLLPNTCGINNTQAVEHIQKRSNTWNNKQILRE